MVGIARLSPIRAIQSKLRAIILKGGNKYEYKVINCVYKNMNLIVVLSLDLVKKVSSSRAASVRMNELIYSATNFLSPNEYGFYKWLKAELAEDENRSMIFDADDRSSGCTLCHILYFELVDYLKSFERIRRNFSNY